MACLFPHTIVPPWAAELLLALFDEVIVFQPVVDSNLKSAVTLEASSRFKTLCPYQTGHEKVNQAVNAYMRWADQHHGVDLKQLSSRLDAPFFFNEKSSYQLEALIRPTRKAAPSEKRLDPAQKQMNHRIFLSLAQEFDLRHWEMEVNRKNLEAAEDRLFDELHGGSVKTGRSQKTGRDSQTNYMVRERMDAWSALMAQSEKAPSPLVTLYPEIVSLIEETVPADKFLIAKGWAPLDEDEISQSQWRGQFKKALDNWRNEPSQALDLSALLFSQKPSEQKCAHIHIYGVCDCDIIDGLGESGCTDRDGVNNLIVLVLPENGAVSINTTR